MIPFELGLAAGPWAVVFGLIAATFVNEDLACIAAGLLLAAGKIEWPPALAGCFLGIVLGDFGVWLLGRAAGTRAMRWNWSVSSRVPAIFPLSSRVASSSASRSRAPSPSGRRCCSATSRRAPSTSRPASWCSRPSSASTGSWAPARR